jgi:hypothetical protein
VFLPGVQHRRDCSVPQNSIKLREIKPSSATRPSKDGDRGVGGATLCFSKLESLYYTIIERLLQTWLLRGQNFHLLTCQWNPRLFLYLSIHRSSNTTCCSIIIPHWMNSSTWTRVAQSTCLTPSTMQQRLTTRALPNQTRRFFTCLVFGNIHDSDEAERLQKQFLGRTVSEHKQNFSWCGKPEFQVSWTSNRRLWATHCHYCYGDGWHGNRWSLCRGVFYFSILW